MVNNNRGYLAGLSDDEIEKIQIPAIVFSGPGGAHPQHTAEKLDKLLPNSTLVISSEYYSETWEAMLNQIEEKGGEYFDASLATRIDKFIKGIL